MQTQDLLQTTVDILRIRGQYRDFKNFIAAFQRISQTTASKPATQHCWKTKFNKAGKLKIRSLTKVKEATKQI